MSEEAETTAVEDGPRDGKPDDEAFTGPPASEGERRAALRLAEELGRRGHQVKVDPISVRVETGLDTVTHVVLALASGILGLFLPLAGAVGCLAVAFSFFSGRSLGFPLIGRLLPKRATQNVLSPEPGPAWIGLDVIICAGYDANRPYPFAKYLERFWSGRLTIDRIAFWGGMIPLFAVLMLRVTGVDGTAIGVVQLLVSIVLLGVLAAEADRRLVVDRSGPESRPAAALGVIETLDELAVEQEDGPTVGIALFGGESASAAGAEAFLREVSASREGRPALIALIDGGPGPGTSSVGPLVTAREGDLSVMPMNDELAGPGGTGPGRAILRRLTAAGVARRRGLVATSVVGSGDEAIDLVLEIVYRATAEETLP
ncbi:MAG: hypothetical protein ACKOGM_01325 [Solirubrobacterales bacterium]